MKIYFCRHGESHANLSHTLSNRDAPHGLTNKGREQAEILAQRLREHPITNIYTSPVPRAIETSEIVAWHLGLPYSVVDALREYDTGILEGRSDPVAWQEWHRVFNAWYFDQRYNDCLEGGEGYFEIRRRFVSFFDDLVRQFEHSEAEVVCISHGAIYALMLPLVVTDVDQALIKKYGLDYTFTLVAEYHPAGLVAVEWDGQPLSIRQEDKHSISG